MLMTRMTPKMIASPREMMSRMATMLNPVRNCAKTASAIQTSPLPYTRPRAGKGRTSPLPRADVCDCRHAKRRQVLVVIVPDFEPFGTLVKSQSLSGYRTFVHGCGRIQMFDVTRISNWIRPQPWTKVLNQIGRAHV